MQGDHSPDDVGIEVAKVKNVDDLRSECEGPSRRMVFSHRAVFSFVLHVQRHWCQRGSWQPHEKQVDSAEMDPS